MNKVINKLYEELKKEENKVKVLNYILVFLIALCIFTGGRLLEVKRYKKDFEKLRDDHKTLNEEYQEYKQNSYILIGGNKS